MRNLKTYSLWENHKSDYKLFESNKKKDLDLELFKEIISTNYNEQKIISLINKGASFNHINSPADNINGLHLAAKNDITIFFKYPKLIEEFIYSKAIDGKTPLHFAAEYGSINFIQKAFEQDLNLNVLNNNGDSLLISAVRNAYSDKVFAVVEFLIQYVDVDIQNKIGNTALIIATKADNDSVVKTLLIDALANPTIENNYGKNIFSYIFGDCKNIFHDKEIQEDLIERYPSVITELYKIKMLHKDIIKQHPEITSGVDLNLL